MDFLLLKYPVQLLVAWLQARVRITAQVFDILGRVWGVLALSRSAYTQTAQYPHVVDAAIGGVLGVCDGHAISIPSASKEAQIRSEPYGGAA
jgi:hypothetical protein